MTFMMASAEVGARNDFTERQQRMLAKRDDDGVVLE
jgi:hypothetical protein